MACKPNSLTKFKVPWFPMLLKNDSKLPKKMKAESLKNSRNYCGIFSDLQPALFEKMKNKIFPPNIITPSSYSIKVCVVFYVEWGVGLVSVFKKCLIAMSS